MAGMALLASVVALLSLLAPVVCSTSNASAATVTTTPHHSHNYTVGKTIIVSSESEWPTCSCAWAVLYTMVIQAVVTVLVIVITLYTAYTYPTCRAVMLVEAAVDRVLEFLTICMHRDVPEQRTHRYRDLERDAERDVEELAGVHSGVTTVHDF